MTPTLQRQPTISQLIRHMINYGSLEGQKEFIKMLVDCQSDIEWSQTPNLPIMKWIPVKEPWTVRKIGAKFIEEFNGSLP